MLRWDHCPTGAERQNGEYAGPQLQDESGRKLIGIRLLNSGDGQRRPRRRQRHGDNKCEPYQRRILPNTGECLSRKDALTRSLFRVRPSPLGSRV
jgi:hypothetical protein